MLPSRGIWRVAATIGLVAIFLCESGPVVAGHSAAALPSTPATHSPGSVAPTNSPPFRGFSEQTLELLNGTLVAGDRAPPTGQNPVESIPDPAVNKVYVVSGIYQGGANLDVVNATTDALIVELPLPYPTGWATFDAQAGLLLFPGGGATGGSLRVFNTSTGSFTETIPLTDSPRGMAVDPDNGLVYGYGFDGPNGGDVVVVNLTSATQVATILVGAFPGNIVADPANGDLYVANSGSDTVSVINGSNDTVVATIRTGNWPSAMAVDPVTDTVYILDELAPVNLTVVNGTTNTINASIPLPSPYNTTGVLQFDGSRSLLYIALNSGSNVSILSTRNNSFVRNVSVGNYPFSVALDPAAGTIVVAITYPGTLEVFGAANWTILGSEPYSPYSSGVSVDPSTGRVYLPNTGTGQLQVVNGSSGAYLANVTLALSPDGILYDPASGDLYVTEPATGEVTFVNGTTLALAGTVSTGSGASHITLCTSVDRVVVTNSGAGTVTVLNATTNAIVATTKVGSGPSGTAWDPSDGDVFVADTWDDNVTVLNGTTGAVVTTIPGFFYPSNVAVDPADREVYVMGSDGGSISIVNDSTYQVVANVTPRNATLVDLAYDPATADVWVLTDSPNVLLELSGANNSIVASVRVTLGGDAVGMAVDPTNGTIVVNVLGGWWQGTAVFVNATSSVEIGRAPVGNDSGSILFDPSSNLLLDENLGDNTVSVLNLSGETALGTYPTGADLANLALDPNTSTFFATNYGAGTLTVLGPAFPYPVQFQETGLPRGATWSVSLAGENTSSNNGTVGFEANNGTHAYSIPDVPGFLPTPTNGNVTVGGAALNVSVTFRTAYPVTFRETGLPLGTNWSVRLNQTVLTTAGTSVTFPEANGSYPYRVFGLAGWRASNYSGTIVVNGRGAVEGIGWTQAVYTVNFTAVGLPAGKSWAVIVNGSTYRNSVGTISLILPNGSYAYSIAGAPGFAPRTANGSVQVAGSSLNRTVPFTAGFLVDFSETGLPGGMSWSVALNGSLNLSSGATIGFEVPNGTLSYDIENLPGWRADAYGGIVEVPGAPRYVAVSWNRTVYPITFDEAGLPVSTRWFVVVGSDTLPSTTWWVALAEPNGTFPFSVGNVPGWRASTYGGEFNVSGRARVFDIDWTQTTYPVAFDESGLPAHTEWRVTLRSSPQFPANASVSLGPEIDFAYPNGTYLFQVVGIPGWRASPSSGFAPVSGGPVQQTIVWTNVTFDIHVAEQGLPAGTSWAVTLRGVTNRTEVPVLDFAVLNGSYALNVSNVPGWRASLYSWYALVQGEQLNFLVNWTRTTYTATVSETGAIPRTTVWAVDLNGSTQSGPEAGFSFSGLPNGTYSLVVRPPAGYGTAAPPPSTLTISGGPAEVRLSFQRTPSGATSGATSPATWELLVGGAVVVVGAAGLAILGLRRRRPPDPIAP